MTKNIEVMTKILDRFIDCAAEAKAEVEAEAAAAVVAIAPVIKKLKEENDKLKEEIKNFTLEKRYCAEDYHKANPFWEWVCDDAWDAHTMKHLSIQRVLKLKKVDGVDIFKLYNYSDEDIAKFWKKWG